jgi:metal-responsive CopG/Arc/MetJ family transcriptional regulator
MAVIPVRLSDDEVKQIDVLVRREARSSRSKVIREILHEHLAEKLSNEQDVSDIVESLIRLSAEGREPVKLRFKTSATEAVSEGRD